MGLILPPWQFANGVSNLSGTPPSNGAVGTNFTAGANNADGTAVQVLSALAFDVHYLVVGFGGFAVSAGNGQVLADILTDPAGGTSWGAFINDLVCGMTPSLSATMGIAPWYHFPVYIPAGSAVAVQARTRHTSNITSGRVIAYAYGNPSRPSAWWCGQKVESLGINAATSQGTDVVPGNSGVDGSWTTIGSSGFAYGAVQYGINGSDSGANAAGYFWELGVGSVAYAGAPKSYRTITATEQGSPSGLNQPIFCDEAAGTTWQIRGTCSTTAETFNAAVYGVY